MNALKLDENTWSRWIITFILVLVTALEILDMTIVTVSLQDMRGSLGATSEQISWTVTSYMVMSAIVMPLSGFLTARLGRKRLLFVVIIGFGVFSALCGFAANLAEIVAFRALQGGFGALLAPISQATINDLFANRPDSERNKSMALYGMGIMTAPVFGPIIGGYLTQNINWRWDFFVNIPICLIVLPLIAIFITETGRKSSKVDWLGMSVMALAVGSFQVVLDQGSSKGWFASDQIIVLSMIAVSSFAYFLYRGIRMGRKNIINLGLFKDRLFAGSIFLILAYCMVLMGLLSWLPLFLETLLQYPALTTGEVLAPRGIIAAIAMMMLPLLMRFIAAHWLVMLGFLLTASGGYLMMSTFNLYIDPQAVLIPNLIQGAASALVFVPLARTFYGNLSPEDHAEAAGIFSFARSIGGSIGVSIMGTIFVHLSQVNWNELSGYVNVFNHNLTRWLEVNHQSIQDSQTIARLGNIVNEQATMLAFNDVFYFATVSSIILLPCALVLRKKVNKVN
ncbi:Multidrug resistance protein B [Piscirickettsia salmonis]|uniref:H+ antiporter-2 family protein n=1 Tax=Piscirickettsia salmonis TaxID=1238 RepID=A0A1L6TA54_PISSA|nr:DHA2 family efflux MFS transporter permease subunit [Piscirickettsia salmonis]AKP73276.1 cation:proton antiporter [Piscirickettsia salmonis LF-89 = ATCC VR-1361]ALB21970.1 H+ antiporter-2 family protein [Piscirickettsia salmonis]ALY02127.1 cation:proton antiporter [Piscirickettsia salmonis]AMA41641.1 cation:proton antiporter [Piscirickettsia salmonis]AOS34124.1 cation:proton antiporter [Piscirickettsia salmonis]